jgi:hypothetical protein
LLGQIIVFDLEKQHARKTSNTGFFNDFFLEIIFSLVYSYLFCIENIEIANIDSRTQLNQTSTSLSTLSNLLISLLHPWLFEKNIDQICYDRLHLNRPNRFLSYGILSKNEHLSIVLPTWQQYLNDNIPETFLSNPTTLISFIGMETNEAEVLKQYEFEYKTNFNLL